MNSALRMPDLFVLVAYLLGMVGMGVWFGRRNKTPEHFMKASGAVPGWAVGLSIFGTYVSSISFLALPGKAYAENWSPFAFSLMIPITAWAAVKWFVPFYRKTGEISAYEHLERRFGNWARTYAVACYLLTQIGRMGTIMYLLALALRPMIGWSMPTLILVTGVIVIIYTLIGGMEAVIWTDVIQSVIFIGGSIACVLVLMLGTQGGPSKALEIAFDTNKFSLGSWDADFTRATVLVIALNSLFINLQNFGIDQSYVQRYAAAATDREAAKSVWLGALLYLPVSAAFLLIGSLLFSYYSTRPEALPPGLKGDGVFPHFIATALPVGLSGLVVASIFAAAQSTIASSVNCSATLTLCDLYKRYLRPGASAGESMAILRIATIGYGVLGVLAAFAMMGVTSSLDAWWAISSVCSGGMLGLFLLGILSRASNPAAALATALGVLVIVWMTISSRWPEILGGASSRFHSFMITVVGTLVILVAGLGLGLLLKGKQPAGSGFARAKEKANQI